MSLLGSAAIVAGTGLAAGAIGRGIKGRQARKMRERFEKTTAGAAEKRALDQAAARQISGDYGSGAAKMRQDASRAAEGGREEARMARREMLANVVKGGGFGRSGAATDALTGISQAQMANQAQAGRTAADISQRTAEATQRMDRGVLETGVAAERMYEKRLQKMRQRGAEMGRQIGTSLASGAIAGPAETADIK